MTFQFTDYVKTPQSEQVDGGGAALIEFPALDPYLRWHITRLTVSCTGSITPAPIVAVYIVPAGESATQLHLRSGTDAGLFDEADYPDDGLLVMPNEQLVVAWAGAPPGATAVAIPQYELWTDDSWTLV